MAHMRLYKNVMFNIFSPVFVLDVCSYYLFFVLFFQIQNIFSKKNSMFLTLLKKIIDRFIFYTIRRYITTATE